VPARGKRIMGGEVGGCGRRKEKERERERERE